MQEVVDTTTCCIYLMALTQDVVFLDGGRENGPNK